MGLLLGKGGNYEIHLKRGVALCRVWKRPDVSREEGARYAEEMVRTMAETAAGSRAAGKAAILDMSEAPTSWGPATEASLGQILTDWERSRRRIAVQMSDDPIQGLLIRRMCKAHAPAFGMAVSSLEEATVWIEKGVPPARGSRR
jgi:hypothetical protein